MPALTPEQRATIEAALQIIAANQPEKIGACSNFRRAMSHNSPVLRDRWDTLTADAQAGDWEEGQAILAAGRAIYGLPEPDRVLNARISPDLYQRASDRARQEGISLTEFAAKAIEAALKFEQKT